MTNAKNIRPSTVALTFSAIIVTVAYFYMVGNILFG